LKEFFVSYTLEDFIKDCNKERLHLLSPKERLEGLSPKERLEGLTSEQKDSLLQLLLKRQKSQSRKAKRKRGCSLRVVHGN
jgi:hypothetical protein